jgi:outer membrane protein assembly factor BamB
MNQKMNLKKKTMTALFLILVTLGASAFAYSQDWPMLGHDPQNTGYTSSNGPSTGDLQWVYTTEGTVVSSPVVVDGKVYIGLEDGARALDADLATSCVYARCRQGLLKGWKRTMSILQR